MQISATLMLQENYRFNNLINNRAVTRIDIMNKESQLSS